MLTIIALLKIILRTLINTRIFSTSPSTNIFLINIQRRTTRKSIWLLRVQSRGLLPQNTIFLMHQPITHSSGYSAVVCTEPRNPSIYNIICWVAWTMGQTNHRPSVWCSKYYFFHDFLQNSLQKSFQFIFFFIKLQKK